MLNYARKKLKKKTRHPTLNHPQNYFSRVNSDSSFATRLCAELSLSFFFAKEEELAG